MIETTYSQAREQLKTLMGRAVDDREVVLVRRRSGGAVAMIAADGNTATTTDISHMNEKNNDRKT
jgi:hypothetical protein